MRPRFRKARIRCFSCGYEERKLQAVSGNCVHVTFKKCPKCGRRNFSFYRFCH